MDSIKNIRVGQVCRVLGFSAGAQAYRQQLLAMGITPGTEFKITHIAPLGDPIQILIRGFSLSLRKNEASILQIKTIKEPLS